MKQLLVEILKVKPHSTYHPGDLDWRCFTVSAGYPLQEMIRFWVDEQDSLLGWLFVYPSPKKLDLVAHTSVSGAELEARMLEDIEAYLSSLHLNESLDMFVLRLSVPCYKQAATAGMSAAPISRKRWSGKARYRACRKAFTS